MHLSSVLTGAQKAATCSWQIFVEKDGGGERMDWIEARGH